VQHAYGNYAVQHVLGKRNRSLKLSSFAGLAEALSHLTAASSPYNVNAAINRAILLSSFETQPGAFSSGELAPIDIKEPIQTTHPLFGETVEALSSMSLAPAMCRCFRGR
jgi:hypothetical protein